MPATCRFFLVGCALLALGTLVAGEGEVPVDATIIATQRSAVAASASLSAEERQQALSLLDDATAELERAKGYRDEVATLADEAGRVAQLEQQARDQLAEAPAAKTLPEDADLEQVVARLGQRQADLAGAQARLNLDEELAQLRSLAGTAGTELGHIAVQLEQAPPVTSADLAPGVVAAQRLQRAAHRRALEARRTLLERRLAVQPVILPLRELQHQAAEAAVERERLAVERLQGVVDTLRQQGAASTRQQAQQARSQAADDPALQRVLDEVVTLATDLEQLVALEADLDDELKAMEKRADALEADFTAARRRSEVGPPTEATALAWRLMRQSLPSAETARRAVASRRERLARLNDRVFLADRELTSGAVAPAAGTAGTALGQARRQRRDLLVQTRDAARRCIGSMEQLELAERRYHRTARELGAFLDVQLLWTRSARPMGLASFLDAPSSAWTVLAAPDRWRAAGAALAGGGRTWWSLLTLVVVVALLALRRRIRRLGGADRAAAERRPTIAEKTAYTPVLRSLAAALATAAILPGLVVVTAWRVGGGAVDAVGIPAALAAVAGVWFGLGFLREICRDGALAHRFLGWGDEARRYLRRCLGLYLVPALPLRFVRTLAAAAEPVTGLPCQRLALLAHVTLMVVLVVALFRAGSPLVAVLRERHPDSWLVRARWAWFPLLAILPVVQAVLAATGFQYSAEIIDLHVRASVGWLLALLLLRDLLLHAILVARRRLLLADFRRRRRAGTEGSSDDDAVAADVPDARELAATVDGRTRNLLRVLLLYTALVGLWFIWDQVLPALRYLDGIELWRVGDDGGIPITLMGLIAAVFGLVLTFVAGHNLPMVLDVLALSRTRLEAGTRHAVRLLTGYLIVTVGLVLVVRSFGVTWSSVQWLVAALGVGLGFGLQEVVANFVSGIIILVERPYRIGDVISVGQTSGTVTNISIRSTRIVDWDRKELIVPNKDFIAQPLVNWSLSDPITRLVVPVGVAYGSDTEAALAILHRLAGEATAVLDEPPPRALFLGFGDNALQLELRVFIDAIARRFEVLDALHRAIDAAFREAGITIAFPQRDVHLDAGKPVPVRVVSEAEGEGGG